MTILSLKEQDIFTFTSDGCYPTKQDISQALGKWKLMLVLSEEKMQIESLFILLPQSQQCAFDFLTEDKTVVVMCTALGWEIPETWRLIHRKESKLG